MNLVAQYLTLFIIIIVYDLCPCEAEWEIVSTDPKSRHIQVHTNKSVRLMVTVNGDIRRCTWIQPGTNDACEFQYEHAAQTLVKQETCKFEKHEERIHAYGDYERHQCGIEISNVGIQDQGQWQVEVKEYIDVNLFSMFLYEAITDKTSFQVTVIANHTTSNPATGMSPNAQATEHSDSRKAILTNLMPFKEHEMNEDGIGKISISEIVGMGSGLFAIFVVMGLIGYWRHKRLIMQVKLDQFKKFDDVHLRTGRINYSKDSETRDTANAITMTSEKALEKLGVPTLAYSKSRRIF